MNEFDGFTCYRDTRAHACKMLKYWKDNVLIHVQENEEIAFTAAMMFPAQAFAIYAFTSKLRPAVLMEMKQLCVTTFLSTIDDELSKLKNKEATTL